MRHYYREIQLVAWEELRVAGGRPATDIPVALTEFLESHDSAEQNKAYWRIDNAAIVQGGVSESMPPVIDVLLASLLDELPARVRIQSFDLIFMAVKGFDYESQKGNLVEECIARARRGLWLLYQFAKPHFGDGIIELLEAIEIRPERVAIHCAP